MKKLKFIFSLLAIVSLSFLTSCDDEPLDPVLSNMLLDDDDNNGSTGVFKVNFNNQTWVADDVLAYISGNTIKLEANKGTSDDDFAFLLVGNTTGTYPANENLVIYSPAGTDFGYDGINLDNPEENTGSVTVTSIDVINKTISGYFSYKGYWSNEFQVPLPAPINFTNGIFQNIPYTTESPTQDTFYAKVNGTEFVDTDINVIAINGVLGVAGTNAGGNSITVGVKESLGVGSYTMTGNILTDVVQVRYDVGATYYATSGTVTITSKTATRIKGTFTASVTNGTNTFQITEGQFDVAY